MLEAYQTAGPNIGVRHSTGQWEHLEGASVKLEWLVVVWSTDKMVGFLRTLCRHSTILDKFPLKKDNKTRSELRRRPMSNLCVDPKTWWSENAIEVEAAPVSRNFS